MRRYAPGLSAALLIAGVCAAGTGAGAASAATARPADLTPSATALTVSAPSVAYGDEQTEAFTVTVTGAGGTPTGTVTVAAGAATVCTITLGDDGTGSCPPTADEFPVGPVTLTAAYGGDDAYDPSTSPAAAAATLTIAKEPTATAVALSAKKVSYGAEQHERVTVAVKAAYKGTPTGRVTVKAGSTAIRVITLTGGKGATTLPAAGLAAGAPKLTLTYSGDANDAGSAAAAKLAVGKVASKTALGVSATTLTFGAEQHERITVAVKPAYAGTPAGRVTVKAGSTAICVIPLKSGRGACPLPATRLGTGKYRVTAVYGGSNDLVASASAARTLSVGKAPSTTGLALSAAKVRYGSEGTEKISVKVAPRYAGTPGGTVTVRANGATLAVIKLKAGAKSFALSAKRFPAGTYTLVASYAGNAEFTGSTSAKRALTVTSPPPPPPPAQSCHPLSSKGTCYEPGEFCPAADHGETGVAGDGEQIICADNNGWRWEPLD